MRELCVKAFAVESGETKYYKEIAGDSSETKPTDGLIDGSIFLETDTGIVSFFNEEDGEWVEQFSFREQGG